MNYTLTQSPYGIFMIFADDVNKEYNDIEWLSADGEANSEESISTAICRMVYKYLKGGGK